jgi:hypothetical protein
MEAESHPFMVPMHAQLPKEALQEPRRSGSRSYLFVARGCFRRALNSSICGSLRKS